MLDKIKYLIEEIPSIKAGTSSDLESFRLRYLSKKGLIPELFEEFRNIPSEQKKEVGQKLNELKQMAQERYNFLKKCFPNK